MNSHSLETISENEPAHQPAVIDEVEIEQTVPAAEADHLLEVVRKQAKRRKTFKGIVTWTGWSAVSTICVGLFVYLASWKTHRTVSVDLWRWDLMSVTSGSGDQPGTHISIGGFWIFLITFLAAAHVVARVATRRQSRSSRELAAFDDLRSTGLLVEALELPEKQTREVAAEALKPLLSRLQASDAALLNKNQRGILAKAMSVKDPDLTRRILAAFGQVGAVEQRAAVEKLERESHWEHLALAEAARSCLEAFERHAEDTKARERLLRPSQGTATETSLLRPAGAAEHAETVLLRASEGE